MRYIYILSVFLLSFTMYSCGGNSKSCHETKKTKVVDKTTKEYTSAYICPMYCKGSGSDEMGNCPTCGMDYELNEEKSQDHDGHNHSHDGHNHDGHDHNHDGHHHH